MRTLTEGQRTLVDEYLPEALRFARIRAHGVAQSLRERGVDTVAEDLEGVAVDALIKAVRGWRGDCAFSTFFYQVFRTGVVDYLRRERRHLGGPLVWTDDSGEEHEPEDPVRFEDAVETRHLAGAILKARENLPPVQRRAFDASRAGKKSRDLAGEWGCAAVSIRRADLCARASIKEMLR